MRIRRAVYRNDIECKMMMVSVNCFFLCVFFCVQRMSDHTCYVYISWTKHSELRTFWHALSFINKWTKSQ